MVSRWLDVTTHLTLGKSPTAELWLACGWAERMGYNPYGIGRQGLGTVTSYTLQEIAAIPHLDAQLLLAYLDQVGKALSAFLQWPERKWAV